MEFNIYLFPFICSFVLATLLLFLLVGFGKKIKFKESRKNSRHLHSGGILRFGGLAIIFAFVLTLFADSLLFISTPLKGVVIASLVILIYGVIDDLKQLDWKIQIFIQVLIVIFTDIMGVKLQYITNPFGGMFFFDGRMGNVLALLLSIVWIVFMMNAMNWVDGIDGVSGGISLIGCLTIFILSLRPEVNQPPIAIVATALAGSILAFVLFNFHPAKILAGTSGSMFMGYILAVLAIFSGAKIATTILVMVIPILDSIWVVFQRMRAGVSIFMPDRRHLHFRLLDLGWSQKKIVLFYYLISSFVAALALSTNALGKSITFILIGLLLSGVLLIVERKTKKIKEV